MAAATSLTPEQRALRARIAGLESWANTTDRRARSSKGQAGLLAKFEREVDPDGILDPAVRRERAEAKRKAHMARLSLASSKARAAKKAS